MKHTIVAVTALFLFEIKNVILAAHLIVGDEVAQASEVLAQLLILELELLRPDHLEVAVVLEALQSRQFAAAQLLAVVGVVVSVAVRCVVAEQQKA